MTKPLNKYHFHETLVLPENRKSVPALKDPIPFGRLATDHMFECDFIPEQGGWQQGKIKPFGDWQLSPDALVFHYGQQIFEGLKAFRGDDQKIRIFRPQLNAERFYHSAEKLGMEPVPVELFVEAVKSLVKLDEHWVLKNPGSLYIRPLLIPLDQGVSYRASKCYRFAVMLSPAKSYFSNEQSVSVMVEREKVRAVRGGVGEAKAGGNYAAAVAALNSAKERKVDHVLWLDGVERRFVEEVGAMNVMFVYQDRIVTPQLSGSILRGVTRRSLLEWSAMKGEPIKEEKIPVDQLLSDIAEGRVKEAFGCGTAAVISPIREIYDADKVYKLGTGEPGPIALSLKAELEGIQSGRLKDPGGWLEVLL